MRFSCSFKLHTLVSFLRCLVWHIDVALSTDLGAKRISRECANLVSGVANVARLLKNFCSNFKEYNGGGGNFCCER